MAASLIPLLKRTNLLGAWAVTLVLSSAAPALAAGPGDATRARVDPASMALPMGAARDCWARFATSSGQPRNGVIEEVAFRVPCPEQMGERFIQTLQRALQARGYHDGPITGRADPQTRAAVQAFQKANGFNSPILTLETAQRLGLLPIEITRN